MKQVLIRFILAVNVVRAANERTINKGLAGYCKNEKSFAGEQYFKKVNAMSYGLTTFDVETVK